MTKQIGNLCCSFIKLWLSHISTIIYAVLAATLQERRGGLGEGTAEAHQGVTGLEYVIKQEEAGQAWTVLSGASEVEGQPEYIKLREAQIG